VHIVAVGLNHRTAAVEVRERLAVPDSALPEWLEGLRRQPGVLGCLLLSTCNRTEVYASLTAREEGLRSLLHFLAARAGLEMPLLKKYLYILHGNDAVRHLFRVAAGLDSMILGETQILGQVRRAYQVACDGGATDPLLNTLCRHAIGAGKRVRTETGIDQHPVSVSYAAVELAKKILGGLEGRLVLIIGAGKMGELTARYLVENGVAGVIVSNRSFDRACELAERFGGTAVRFDVLLDYLPRADIVISGTAATHYVIRYPEMARAVALRGGAPIFLIDIAVPRDIDPEVKNLPGVVLYDIDDLHKVVDHNLAVRRRAAAAGEIIVEEEAARFMTWYRTLAVVPTITALRRWADEIKESEVRRALNRLGNPSEREANVIRALAHGIVNKLLDRPVRCLKEKAAGADAKALVEVVHELFDLDPGRDAQEMDEGVRGNCRRHQG